MKEGIDIINITIIFLVIGFLLGAVFGYFTNVHNNVSTPVKETKIDSLIVEREVIKIKVDELDSIKNAKVIEVSSLDNDSTLKLFYELVKE